MTDLSVITAPPWPDEPVSGATFSACQAYRYHLWRNLICQPVWGSCALFSGHHGRHDAYASNAAKGTCLFLMLNPSTADHEANDPTVERCQRRAKAWGFNRLEVCNIFALRSTDPKALYGHADPVGPHNDEIIADRATKADLVICAWGTHGTTMKKRGHDVVKLLRGLGVELHALKIAKGGEPCHPLYLSYELKPIPFT